MSTATFRRQFSVGKFTVTLSVTCDMSRAVQDVTATWAPYEPDRLSPVLEKEIRRRSAYAQISMAKQAGAVFGVIEGCAFKPCGFSCDGSIVPLEVQS